MRPEEENLKQCAKCITHRHTPMHLQIGWLYKWMRSAKMNTQVVWWLLRSLNPSLNLIHIRADSLKRSSTFIRVHWSRNELGSLESLGNPFHKGTQTRKKLFDIKDHEGFVWISCISTSEVQEADRSEDEAYLTFGWLYTGQVTRARVETGECGWSWDWIWRTM